MEEAIIVSHISKSYGKKVTTPLPHREGQGGGAVGAVPALQDVSFTVSKGEVFGLIGPDGAGKTSMFRILNTLLLPDEGTATVDGFDVVRQATAIRQRVGYMPGRFSLYQDLTVEENLKFFATLFGTTIDEGYDSIRAIYSQIERFSNRKAGALSGGMKQKLALSCALVHSPSVLFLDEPTTGVDPVSRKELWEMLAMLKEREMTIVASTPYLDEVRRCDRVAFLSEGRVQGIDTPEVILEQFREIFNPPPLKAHAMAPTPYPFREEGSAGAAGENQSFSPSEGAGDGVSNQSISTSEGAGDGRPLGNGTEEAVISVEHLVKSFGSFNAVDDISLKVWRGEIFGFLGANGAGKTTAMRMLTGLSQPTSGRGHVAGFDISAEHEQIKRHIGYMSQKFSLYEDLSIKENIRLFAGIYGMTPSQMRAERDALLHRLGLEDRGDDLVKSLPLGWKQRLAFSVSIIHHPEIVFLDEPTGGVDPATRRQFWELIYDAAARGITVFVTTHYMDEAEYCDRVSIMVDGRISAMGTPEELKQQFGQPDIDHVFTHLARQESATGRSRGRENGVAEPTPASSEREKGVGAGSQFRVGSFLSFVIKEARHILRDKRTMLILFGMPIVLMLLFGFAITNEVRNVRTVVVSAHMSPLTQRAIDRLAASEYFTITATVGTPAEAERLIRHQKADMGLIPSAPSQKQSSGHTWQLMVDGSDPNMAQQWTAYAQSILSAESMGTERGLAAETTASGRLAMVNQKMLYNPQMKSAYNFVPAIMGMLLMLICAMMTSISIVREKERGTMEVLLVSPVRPLMIIVAKAVPYLVLAFAILVAILFMARFVLEVPLAGSLVWIVLVSTLYIVLALSLGLLISNVASSQLMALLLSAMVLLMPIVMLSGMLFPIESMPDILQWVSAVVPPRYYIEAMRKLMIMGVSIGEVGREVAVLALMTAVLLAVALRKFKTRLE